MKVIPAKNEQTKLPDTERVESRLPPLSGPSFASVEFAWSRPTVLGFAETPAQKLDQLESGVAFEDQHVLQTDPSDSGLRSS